MPRPGDDPDQPVTLPQAELNPLLNPTLGQHMGRWAEVYFTSPPEKRDEAVQELIRELQNQDSATADAVTRQSSAGQRGAVTRPAPSTTAAESSQGLTCFWCGYVNRAKYKFCGRCGEPLAASLPDPRIERRSDSTASSGGPARMFPSRQPASQDAASAAMEDEFPRGRGDDSFHAAEDTPTLHLVPEPEERSFRPWFAAVLAVVLIALAYVAWRGGPKTTPAARSVETAPAADSATAQPVSVPVSSKPATSTPASTATQNPAPTPSVTTPNGVTPNAVTPNTGAQNVVTPNQVATSPTSQPSADSGAGTGLAAVPAAATGKGLEELAQARDLLNGTNGKERNPAEAAQWLWKAVRKENIDATMLLSGLYLHGDGIPKNCEQARLLLDAAATKGRKDAAEELRDLSAFGCN